MFYQGEPTNHISISIDQPLNWLYFLADTLGGDDFYPPIARERAAIRSSSDWRSWREQVWDHCVEDPGLPPSPSTIPGMDPEEFASMREWSRLQAQCRSAWPEFLVWWRKAKPMLAAEINSPALQEIVSDRRRPPPLRLHVVALRDAQDLASRGEHHLISVGLLKERVRFRDWLNYQA